jgi:hypothetical protein
MADRAGTQGCSLLFFASRRTTHDGESVMSGAFPFLKEEMSGPPHLFYLAVFACRSMNLFRIFS